MKISQDSSKIHIFVLNSLNSIKSFCVQCIDLKKLYIQLGGLIIAGLIQSIFSTIVSKFVTIEVFIQVTGEFLSLIPILFAMTATTYLYLLELDGNQNITIKNHSIKNKKCHLPYYTCAFSIIRHHVGNMFCCNFSQHAGYCPLFRRFIMAFGFLYQFHYRLFSFNCYFIFCHSVSYTSGFIYPFS